MAWDDEKRQQAIDMYQEGEPTPENSMELVTAIAEELDESPNGVRMILTKAGVYVKKDPGAAGSGGSSSGGGSRVSKAAAQQALADAISAHGAEVDSEIIEKLTGKAAQYLTGVLNSIES